MHAFLIFGLTLAAAAQNPVPQDRSPSGASAAIETTDRNDAGLIDKAFDSIKAQKPADAIIILDGIIARDETKYAGEERLIYTARSRPETLYYLMLAATAKKSAVVLDETWSEAYFLKGFALIDLGRADEAKPLFDKAVSMAPMNSHYLGERGEWYKSRKDWERAYADFKAASEAAHFSPHEMKSFDQRRAWRGMSFVRVEQGRLDDAEKLLRQCLNLDPNDDKAKSELQYIAKQRTARSTD